GFPVRRCHPGRHRSIVPGGSLATWRTRCTCRRTGVGRRRTLQAATSAEQGVGGAEVDEAPDCAYRVVAGIGERLRREDLAQWSPPPAVRLIDSACAVDAPGH